MLAARPHHGRELQAPAPCSGSDLGKEARRAPKWATMRLLTRPLQGRALSAACLLCACSFCAEEAVALCLKISETFYGLAAHTDPQKVSEAFEEPGEMQFALRPNG